MKVFSNCIIVVEFEATTSYKEKSSWRKTITDNGGVISYVLTKKASFFVVFNKKVTSLSFKLKQCAKYNIPVVSPKYVEQCVSKNRLLDTGSYRLKELTHNSEFGKGKIEISPDRKRKYTKKKIVTVNLSSHPSWLFGDVNAPEFDEDSFELPKWSLLITEEQNKVEAIEVHVSTRLDNSVKYRLFAQSGIVENKKVIKTEDAIVWYFHTVSEVLSGYDQLYRQYQNKPLCMTVCEPGTVDMENFGSADLRMALGQLSLLNEKISPQVAALTSLIWREALSEVDSMLETPMQYIKEKQVTEARVILAQLTEKLIGNHSNIQDHVQKLIEQFFEVLPHKQEFRSNDWRLWEVVGKQDLCQLLSDIVSVSEATDWSLDATVIAKYRAMGCHIQQMNQLGDDVTKTDDDFAKIYNLISRDFNESGCKMHNIYRVRRTVEEVNFQTDFGNVRLLTHASPCYNLLGIFSRGLLLPNMVTDKLGVSRTDVGNLGAGIYFSDNPRKSAQYSSQNGETGTRFILLCDVALGQSCQVYQSDSSLTAPPEGYDSLHGVKTTNEKSSEFMDNEFVIYDINQQCARYLVEFSLPGDTVKEENNVTDDLGLQESEMEISKSSPSEKSATKANIDITDVKDIPDPLETVKAGLQGNKKEHIPLKSVHIRGQMMDMVARVVVLQAYTNDNDNSIEAKYVFPLDNTAAVCGFEAFINGKHIIGEVKEKSKARKEYREAVARGDGAYLMEEETPDVFSVSVGNLPPRSDVLIKITYISELQVQDEAITFNIPASVAPWLRDGALANKTQTATESVKVSSNKRCEISLMVSVEMPFDIRKIHSPSHRVKCKKTATKAVVSLPKKASLDDGFQLHVYLAEVHSPRMWVEKHPRDNTQACMLTFYPEFETEPLTEPDILILLDMSNSMKGEAEDQAKKVALLAVDHLPPTCRFNIVIFGSTYRELFPSAQKYNSLACQLAKQFIQKSKARLGSTELWQLLHATQILFSADKQFESLFLVSDGHMSQESAVLEAVKKTAQRIRMFTLGVSSTVNHHLLRSIATMSGGTYEHYNKDTKSQWQGRLLSQLEKTTQPGLTDVHVDWQQTNENATPPTQAPNHIPCLFSGCRQVVYGFVESCTQATLRAKVNGNEVSTMVSTVDLNFTSGTMLHQLAARAVITDYEKGNLHNDIIKHQVIKNEKKQYIIELSRKHSIVTPYTSFVAIEDRQQENADVSVIPSVADLIKKETVDILPYIGWEPGLEENDKDPLTCVKEILKKGELQESYSMVQAEETYTALAGFMEDIKADSETMHMVYETLSKFYQHDHSELVGNILSEIEGSGVGDFTEFVKMMSGRMLDTDYEMDWDGLNAVEGLDFAQNLEMPCLMPPEVTISPEQHASIEKTLKELSKIPLPDDDELLGDDKEKDLAGREDSRKCLTPCRKKKKVSRWENRITESEESSAFVDFSKEMNSIHVENVVRSARERETPVNYLQTLDSATAIFDPKRRLMKSSVDRIGADSSPRPPLKSIATKAAHTSAPSTGIVTSADAQSSSTSSSFGLEEKKEISDSDDNFVDDSSRNIETSFALAHKERLERSSSPDLKRGKRAMHKSGIMVKPGTTGMTRVGASEMARDGASGMERGWVRTDGVVGKAAGRASKGGKGLGKGGCMRRLRTVLSPPGYLKENVEFEEEHSNIKNDETVHLTTGESMSDIESKNLSLSSGGRVKQSARKSTGGKAPRKVIEINIVEGEHNVMSDISEKITRGTTGPRVFPDRAAQPELATVAARKSAPFAELITVPSSSESDDQNELVSIVPTFQNILSPEVATFTSASTNVTTPNKASIRGEQRTITAPRKQLATKAARKSAPVTHISGSSSSSSDNDSDSDVIAIGFGKRKIKHVISSDDNEEAEVERHAEVEEGTLLNCLSEEELLDFEGDEIFVAEKLPIKEFSQEISKELNTNTMQFGSGVPAYCSVLPVVSQGYNLTSPALSPSSPSYMPAPTADRPLSPLYGPGSPSFMPAPTADIPLSPSYGPGSPSFMPEQTTDRPLSPPYGPGSPSFMPEQTAGRPLSPLYGPGSPSFMAEQTADRPLSPMYGPGSPSYMPAPTAYNPLSHSYSPCSPSYMPTPTAYKPISPSYSPCSPSYMPTPTAYKPISPSYSPCSPSYMPAQTTNRPLSPSYGPCSPSFMPSPTARSHSRKKQTSYSKSLSRASLLRNRFDRQSSSYSPRRHRERSYFRRISRSRSPRTRINSRSPSFSRSRLRDMGDGMYRSKDNFEMSYLRSSGRSKCYRRSPSLSPWRNGSLHKNSKSRKTRSKERRITSVGRLKSLSPWQTRIGSSGSDISKSKGRKRSRSSSRRRHRRRSYSRSMSRSRSRRFKPTRSFSRTRTRSSSYRRRLSRTRLSRERLRRSRSYSPSRKKSVSVSRSVSSCRSSRETMYSRSPSFTRRSRDTRRGRYRSRDSCERSYFRIRGRARGERYRHYQRSSSISPSRNGSMHSDRTYTRRSSRSCSYCRRTRSKDRIYASVRRSRSSSPRQKRNESARRRRLMSGSDRSKSKDVDARSGHFDIKKESFALDTSLVDEFSNLWEGVRAGDKLKILFRRSKLSKLAELLQMSEESSAKRMGYFEMTEELCPLIDINRGRVLQILSNQGVKSLGHKTEVTAERVITTLLVLIFLVKRYSWSSRQTRILKQLNPNSTLTYVLQGNKLTISIDGNAVSMKLRQDILEMDAMIRWLELKYKELPTLYNTLELGKTKMDFLVRLADIYNDL